MWAYMPETGFLEEKVRQIWPNLPQTLKRGSAYKLIFAACEKILGSR